ncbi:hypothetical protein C8A01DRAFT_43699 [Parachaetomium inaequale]|uniref:Uncharacterized protein n=1 Tax=Parachaetomium inaequale TaxID=2588326 RepID=A0AAN6SV44_9PEZI|nr:hypothetical protein C8A01DRAFT_43699 [Parachaetomium inaequale]
MMKAARRHKPLWAETGSGSASVVGVVDNEEGGHGPAATTTLDQGHGRVSDLTLRPQDASRRGRRPPQNADIPPVTFPGGRNPYLDRPLPPPPSRNIAVVASTTPVSMPARPSTSSGPASNKTGGTKPSSDNKRLSKDDMALTGVGMKRGKGLHPTANAPWIFTPEPSPHRMRMPSESPALSPPAGLPTPQSSASGEIQIGMALGSPTQDSTPYSGSPQVGWQPQAQISAQISHSPPPVRTPEPTVQRTKTQKRRLFGSLFGSRKHAEPAKVVEAVEASRSTSSSTTATVSNEAAAPTRSNTVASRKMPKHKPIIIRSMTEPQMDATALDPSVPIISEPLPSISTSSTGLLTVDIPDIRLERYSVMFSGVLNPNGTKSSLLERRQATLEKLKTISDRIEHLEGKETTRPRRATSPQPMKSPAFSLFPQTPNRQSGFVVSTGAAMASTSSLAPPRGLTRSNTSPAYLPSPSRASFEPPPHAMPEQPRKERKTVTIVSPRTMDERNRAAQVEKLREQQQAQQKHEARSHPQTTTLSTTFHFHPNESSLILDSPQSASSPASSSFSSSGDETDPRPTTLRRPALKPALPEPQWQIITPPSSTSSSSSAESAASNTTTTTTTRPRRSTSASSSSVLSSRPSLDTTARVSVDEEDAALKAAVEISIARQISISRQQRRLLRPFGQGGVTMSSSAAAAAAAVANGRGRSATVVAFTVMTRVVRSSTISRRCHARANRRASGAPLNVSTNRSYPYSGCRHSPRPRPRSLAISSSSSPNRIFPLPARSACTGRGHIGSSGRSSTSRQARLRAAPSAAMAAVSVATATLLPSSRTSTLQLRSRLGRSMRRCTPRP